MVSQSSGEHPNCDTDPEFRSPDSRPATVGAGPLPKRSSAISSSSSSRENYVIGLGYVVHISVHAQKSILTYLCFQAFTVLMIVSDSK